MSLTNQQIDVLMQMIVLTKHEEFSCDDCLKRMAEFAEISLQGKPIPDALKEIDDHLKICGECREEFEALKVAISWSAGE